MKYKIIDGVTLIDLEVQVNNHLESGWKLQGGISVSTVRYYGSTYELRYYQALIKEQFYEIQRIEKNILNQTEYNKSRNCTLNQNEKCC